MQSADKIGLLWHMRWLALTGDRSAIVMFLRTWLICVALSPTMLFVVIILFEGRLPSLEPRLMFASVLPGDIFLGTMMAGLVTLAGHLPAEVRWYNRRAWHIGAQCFMLLVVVVIYLGEWLQGYYPSAAMLSPSKTFHHVVLWGFYGYAILTTLVAVIAGSRWTKKFIVVLSLCLLLGSVWARLFYWDSTLPSAEAAPKAANAHVSNWVPFFWDPEAWWKGLTSSR